MFNLIGKQTFAPGESYKKITDSLFYHNHCFLCSGPCHSPIGAEFYDMENGKFLCIECYDKYGSDSDNVNPDEDKYARVPANPPAPAKDLSSDFSNKLNLMQKEILLNAIKQNSHYLVNKSPERLVMNFKDVVLKDL